MKHCVSVYIDRKRLALVLIVAAIICVCLLVSHSGHSIKNDTIEFVKRNSDMIINAASSGDYSSILSKKDMRIDEHDTYTEFLYDSYGLGSEGTYYGFYYSLDDTAINTRYGCPLSEEDDKVGWLYENGNHYYNTQRIAPTLFYFECQ